MWLTLCAWCEKKVLKDGVWVEMSKEEIKKLGIENCGICPSCLEIEEKNLPEGRKNAPCV